VLDSFLLQLSVRSLLFFYCSLDVPVGTSKGVDRLMCLDFTVLFEALYEVSKTALKGYVGYYSGFSAPPLGVLLGDDVSRIPGRLPERFMTGN